MCVSISIQRRRKVIGYALSVENTGSSSKILLMDLNLSIIKQISYFTRQWLSVHRKRELKNHPHGPQNKYKKHLPYCLWSSYTILSQCALECVPTFLCIFYNDLLFKNFQMKFRVFLHVLRKKRKLHSSTVYEGLNWTKWE